MADDKALPSDGDLLAGKYRIQRKLGVGGMGAVFEARHEVTGRRFAIKWLLPEMATRGEGIERFVREARFAGGLEHPNVVDVYDVIEDAGAVFMVMEFLEGESLAERLARVGRFSVADTLRIAVPYLRGVARAHAAGIVHRDLKPANLFICAATSEFPERFKVLDFGISKIIGVPGGELTDSLTNSGSLMGTPFYMSPEQLRGRTVDHRADIYAFGVILHQMLSGTLPFTAATFGDLVLQVLTETAPPLTSLAPDAPPELIGAIERAMARFPEERFESMLQLVAALEQTQDSGAVSGASTSIMSAPGALTTSSTPPAKAIANYKTRPLTSSSGVDLPASQSTANAQLTPLSTESRPPPEPTPSLRPRPLMLAAIASAAMTLLGVLAYWISVSRSGAEPHVVQPLPAESSVSAASQPEPVAMPVVPEPEDTARPDQAEVRPSGGATTPEPAPVRDQAGPRPWPAADGGEKSASKAASKAEAAKSKPAKSKAKANSRAPHINMDPRQF
jgi:serine/threonine protein kinase